MGEEPDKQLYYFSVQDKDAEVLTFSCVARSLEHAKYLAQFCDHKELLLLEVRPLEGFEVPAVAREIAREEYVEATPERSVLPFFRLLRRKQLPGSTTPPTWSSSLDLPR
jgi:hypothetical protein